MKAYIKAGVFAITLAVVAVMGLNSVQAAERHPEIHQAIHSLERAKAHLQEAAHDFGGHRVAAIQACDQALVQLHLALEHDRE